jgi:hypothetical protein
MPGSLPFLAQHHEAGAESPAPAAPPAEAARFDAGQHVGFVLADALGHLLDGLVPSLGVRQQSRDVVEQDARLGKIRDRADVLLEVDLGGHVVFVPLLVAGGGSKLR